MSFAEPQRGAGSGRARAGLALTHTPLFPSSDRERLSLSRRERAGARPQPSRPGPVLFLAFLVGVGMGCGVLLPMVWPDLPLRVQAALQRFRDPPSLVEVAGRRTAETPVSPLARGDASPRSGRGETDPSLSRNGASSGATELPSLEEARAVVADFLRRLGTVGDEREAEDALQAWAPDARESARALLRARDTFRVQRLRTIWVEPVPGAWSLVRVGAVLDLVRGDQLVIPVIQVYLLRVEDGRWLIAARLW